MTQRILRNASEGTQQSGPEFDRKQVLKNTELNAHLGSEGAEVRQRLHDVASSTPQGTKFPKTKAPSALHLHELEEDEGFTESPHKLDFDETNISKWDKQRGQTQKITEPNTPFMGTALDTEYFDDDPVPNDLDLGGSA